MSLESDLFDALKTLVSNRVYPLTFWQPSGALPTWPAIRYTLSGAEPGATVCGDSGEATADVRVQLDLVATTYTALRTLRTAVLAAMVPFATPALWDGEDEEYDEETKTFRARLDYVIYPSSLT